MKIISETGKESERKKKIYERDKNFNQSYDPIRGGNKGVGRPFIPEPLTGERRRQPPPLAPGNTVKLWFFISKLLLLKKELQKCEQNLKMGNKPKNYVSFVTFFLSFVPFFLGFGPFY